MSRLSPSTSRVPVPRSGQSSSAQSSVQNLVGSSLRVGQAAIGNIGQAVSGGIGGIISAVGFGAALRAANLFANAMPTRRSYSEGAWGTSNGQDWRVRLSVPGNFTSSPLLQPLQETNGFVFPYTPAISITHSASYTTMSPVHNNYPYLAYQNSQVDSFTVAGDFLIENPEDGRYWIAAIHYLRSVTKMAYGNTSAKGSPPPVVMLNGYGDYVFKNVPVVVQSFNVDLPSEVDYIQVTDVGQAGSWVPTRSLISVTLHPLYSRRSVSQFSLDAFVRGDYVVNGKGFI